MTVPAELPAPPWPADEAFPRYSVAEYAARWAAFRSLLRDVGASSAIVAGHGAGRAEIQFLCNAPIRWESLLVVPADDQATLLQRLDNHALGMAPWSTLPVEVTGPGLAARAAELVRGPGSPGDAVALLGPISARLDGELREHMGGVPTVSMAAPFARMRAVKSPEELRWTRYGAAICDAAVRRFLQTARPGLREDELGALLTGAVLEAGGQLGICFMATASMRDGGAAVPNQTWSRRVTDAGDLIMFELSAGFGGATGQVLRTVSLGGRPPQPITDLHAVADAVFDELYAAVRPGQSVAELERLGGAIHAAGFTIVDDLVHGYGGGYLPPHVRTPATRREDPGAAVLQAGQLLVLQPNVASNDLRHGVQTGELVEVTDRGAASMHDLPRGLLRLGQAD